MVENFDITMTATLRPELIERTLQSHYERLFKSDIKKARLIINIDMAGEEDRELWDGLVRRISDIIRKYPFREVYPRFCLSPNFAKATVWCFREVRSKYFFNLEEDWELTSDLDFSEMWDVINSFWNLVHLRLSAFPAPEYTCKNWNRFTTWNGRFFEVASKDKGAIGWCGHPSLNRTAFIKEVLEVIDTSKNIEKQIKSQRGNHPINEILHYHSFGVFTFPHSPAAIKDIGREWMAEHGYQKMGNKAFFIKWEKEKI